MNVSLWLRQIHQRFLGSRRTARRAVPPRRSVRLHLESLENRITPSTFNVTPNGSGLASLEGAIAQANKDTGSDTIVLAQGQYLLKAQQTINNPNQGFSLTIEGTASTPNATVIDAGQANNRAFFLSSTTGLIVAFQDLTIQNGKAHDNGTSAPHTSAGGGAILSQGANLTLNNVVLQKNEAVGDNQVSGTSAASSAYGGGLSASDGSVTINHSVIANNNAIGGSGLNGTTNDGTGVGTDGGLGGFAGGGGVAIGGSCTGSITDTTLSGNEAVGGHGTTDIGVYSNGAWYVNTDGSDNWKGNGNGNVQYNFGFPGTIPVAGNWQFPPSPPAVAVAEPDVRVLSTPSVDPLTSSQPATAQPAITSSPSPTPTFAPMPIPALTQTPTSSTTPPPSEIASLIALFFDGVSLEIDTLQHKPSNDVQANIDYLMTYAGSFGPLALQMGEQAVQQWQQQQP